MPRESISPTDGDFIIIIILAVIFDLVDIILNILEFLIAGIPAVSGWLDTTALLIVGWWIYSVSKEKSQSQEEKEKKSLKARIKGRLGREEGGEKPKIKAQKTPSSNIESKLMQRFIARMGSSFFVELIPLASLLPMWTLNALSVLGKETKRTIYMVVFGIILFMPLMFLAVSQILYVAPSVAGEATVNAGFDENLLDLYENPANPNNSSEVLSYAYLLSDAAKVQAINVLGIDPASIRYYQVQETTDLIRAEVCKQWSKLAESQKYGCSQVDAERGILTYALGEAGLLVHFDQTSTAPEDLFVHCETNDSTKCEDHDSKCSSGAVGTLQSLSVTCDKYFNAGVGGKNSRNQQLGAFWDIKYEIYLGVKENIQSFVNRAQGANCQARWDNNWDKVWGGRWYARTAKSPEPGYANKMEWAKAKAAQYAASEYNCKGGASGQIGQFNPPTNEYGYIYPVPPGKGINGTYCEDMGTDITVEIGTPVMSIADGKIEYIGIDEGTCKAHVQDQWCEPPSTPGVAKIIHNDGRKSYYAHLSAIDTNLKAESQVKQGQIIGQSGTANGPHLHISIYEGSNSWSPGKTERLWFSAPYNCSP